MEVKYETTGRYESCDPHYLNTETILAAERLLRDGIDLDKDDVTLEQLAKASEQPHASNGPHAVLALVKVHKATETFSCAVEFTDDGNIESMAKGDCVKCTCSVCFGEYIPLTDLFPHIRTHAIAVHQTYVVLVFERVGLAVDQIAAHFTDILEDETANNEYYDLSLACAGIRGRS